MSKDARISRRELFTGWRKRLTETSSAPEEETQEAEQEQAKSLARENAFKLLDAGDLDAAIEAFRTYIRRELNDDTARMALGSCLYDTGQLVQAKVEFERVLRIRKNDSLASLYLALTLLRMEKFDKVMRLLAVLQEDAADPLLPGLLEARDTLQNKGPDVMPSVRAQLEKPLAEGSLRLA